jgi:neutral ceramidase
MGSLGYGTEAGPTKGFRGRLWARAMVLYGANGEAAAFVVVDLDMVSMIVHRRVAELIAKSSDSRLATDNIVVSATHTHSGPGNFADAWAINVIGTVPGGFDVGFVEFLSGKIAAAIDTARQHMKPARAAWRVEEFWGHTRNRTHDAFILNTNRPIDRPAAPTNLDIVHQSVDPRWWMLRVDVDPDGGSDGPWVPAGALSIFAVHGTGFSSANKLYDSDIQGEVNRRLDEQLATNDDIGFVHLMANGPEGDVSPDWPPETRCRPPFVTTLRRPRGPHTPPPRPGWNERDPAAVAECVERSRDYVEFVSGALAVRAAALHGRFEDAELASDVTVRRTFETFPLRGPVARALGLCESAKAGTALLDGGPDGRTRLSGWKAMGMSLGVESGGSAVDRESDDCHRPKRVVGPLLQSRLFNSGQFPEFAQFTVVQIANAVIGTVPAEVTTTAGRRMAGKVRDGWVRGTKPSDQEVERTHFPILGLANGYLNYVTTREEYDYQSYEGASTLYGPASAEVIGARLDTLASLHQEQDYNGRADVRAVFVRPGPPTHILDKPRETELMAPAFDGIQTCHDGELVAQWLDSVPGDFGQPHRGNVRGLIPADGPMIALTRSGGRPTLTARDDDLRVEVRAKKRSGGAFRWEVRWKPSDGFLTGERVAVRAVRWGHALGNVICQ